MLLKLGACVGSVLSLNSLREDLEVSFDSVRNWAGIFEKLYATFRVAPDGPQKIRAVKKEQQLYFWDWTKAESQAAKMENLVAVHLLRLCHWIEDVEGIATELRYFRTPLGHEVDFVLLKNKKPWMAVEVKANEGAIDSNLQYFLERVEVPHASQVFLREQKIFFYPTLVSMGCAACPQLGFWPIWLNTF